MQENKKFDDNKLIDFDDVIKNSGNKKALFICDSGIENILISTSFLKNFKDTYPDVDVFFGTSVTNHDIVSCNPYIYKAIPLQEEMLNSMLMLKNKKEGYFDYYYNFDQILSHSHYKNVNNLNYNIYE